MNICTPGNCICDAAEWAGDTNCMGEVVGLADVTDGTPPLRYYYWSEDHNVVFSVNTPEEMQPSVDYYLSPDEAARFQKHAFNANFERIALSKWLGRGLLTPEQVAELAGLNPVGFEKRPPAKPGPQGQRRKTFKIKPKRGA